MKKILTLIGAAALCASSFAQEQLIVPIEQESVTFTVTPTYNASTQHFEFKSPENNGLTVQIRNLPTYAAPRLLLSSSETLGYMEFEGRTFSVRTVPAMITRTSVEPITGGKGYMIYNQENGTLSFATVISNSEVIPDDDYCVLLTAYSSITSETYIIGAYKMSAVWGDGTATSFPSSPISNEAIMNPWTFTYEKIEDFDPEYPTFPGTFDGYMNAQTLDGTYRSWEVNASYDDGVLTIDGIGGNYDYPAELKVNLNTGKVTATKQIGYDMLYRFYYSDLATADGVLTGIVRNTENGCEVTLSNWGLYCIDQETWGSFTKYTNSVIYLDFSIEGLTDNPTGDDDDPEDSNAQVADGTMTASEGSATKEPNTYTVKATYEEGQLTITNFGGAANPIVFDVNLETGEVKSQSDQKYNKDYYFADYSTKVYNLFGQMYNLSDSQCVLTVDTWGTKTAQPGFYSIFYNTKVVIDFAIEGLPGYESSQPDYDDDEIVGDWYITMFSYDGNTYYNQETTELFNATLLTDGTLTFAWQSSEGHTIKFGNIIADYDKETRVLTFNNESTFAGAYNPNTDLYQRPIIYNPLEEEVTYAAFTADFDVDNGTIEFNTENSGILWNIISNGTENRGYFGPFIFVAASQNNDGSTGVGTIGSDVANVRYFNLQGAEIRNPQKGQIVIKVEGEKATKMIAR